MPSNYSRFFESVTENTPHLWQDELGAETACFDRLIRIPTGFGKTAGVVVPWLFNRVVRGDLSWPTRLVLALPMRVLVEQTHREIGVWLGRAGLVAEGSEQVGLHLLMGGVDAGDFHLRPERPSVLVGTQDMLLSRALNRGFAAGRARWPIDFGLLQEDALWVLDEVQLMDVGLATSAQLAAFRHAEARHALRPSATWWMSATLQAEWLRTVDFAPRVPPLLEARTWISPDARKGGLWNVQKAVSRRTDVGTPEELAALARDRHRAGSLTLVILNTVERAIAVYDALISAQNKRGKKVTAEAVPDVRLVHSRFRGAERAGWVNAFLRRDADMPDAGRIVVATQVIEAGVDISATTLLTELAPWSSLVQRFGRAARYAGERAQVVVFGAAPTEANKALPYRPEELAAAASALERLGEDAGPAALERFEDLLARDEPGFLSLLYPYAPTHVLRRVDLDDLFDTSPDLSGADLDPSRYIRSGEERDLVAFWRDLPEDAPEVIGGDDLEPPQREELCPVPVAQARKWLSGAVAAWSFDYLDGAWRSVDPTRLYAGMQVMVATSAGGYDPTRGFDPKARSTSALALRPTDPMTQRFDRAAAGEEADHLSQAAWKTIGTHGSEAAREARVISRELGLNEEVAEVLVLSAVWHDLGKGHPQFQRAIGLEARHEVGSAGARQDLAKAPEGAWRKPHPYPDRPGFRHELASMLALFALRGDAAQLRGLDDDQFDLLAWLVVSHHGKVRCRLTPTPKDQAKGHGGIFGVVEGDALPATGMVAEGGEDFAVPSTTLSLELAELGESERFGPSWIERVARLTERRGPFALAYLEALLRAADVRASRLLTEDPRL